jgi:uncharacterized protein YndB with AHSA1/START domain
VTADPLRLSFVIACAPDHAFDVWTTRFTQWWPSGHSASGDPDTAVTLEPGVGGRIYERTSDGVVIVWGEVTAWDPPHRLGYLWHIGRDRSDATDVELMFVDAGHGSTRLEIVHSGWDRLGDRGAEWRRANRTGWQSMVPAFCAAAEK